MEGHEDMVNADHTTPVVVAGCIEVCQRCLAVIERLGNAGGELTVRATEMLGPQLRHCVEHFRCMFHAHAGAVVDYDARARETRLERDMDALGQAFAEIVRRLAEIPRSELKKPCLVLQQAASGSAAAPVPSTVERELLFLSSHTIHHLAIIAEIAASFGLSLDHELGVAFSTARHRRTCADVEA